MRKIIVNPAPAAFPGAAPHRQRESLLVNGSRFFRRHIAAGHFHVRTAVGARQRLQAVGTSLHGAIVTPLVVNRDVRVIPESERIELVKINRADNFFELIGFFPVLMVPQIRKTKKISASSTSRRSAIKKSNPRSSRVGTRITRTNRAIVCGRSTVCFPIAPSRETIGRSPVTGCFTAPSGKAPLAIRIANARVRWSASPIFARSCLRWERVVSPVTSAPRICSVMGMEPVKSLWVWVALVLTAISPVRMTYTALRA